MTRASVLLCILGALATGCLRDNDAFDEPTATAPDREDATGALFPVAPPSGPWWDEAWPLRRGLELAGDPEGATLTGFPAAIELDLAAPELADVRPDGADLRLVADDGTLLAHEVERWEPGARATVWVRLGALPPEGARVWLYWGNPAAPPADDPAGVWTGSYRAVYHMAGVTGGLARDASGAGQHAVAVGGVTTWPEGQVGGALGFDGATAALAADAPTTDGWPALTAEAWVFHASGGDDRVLCRSSGASLDAHSFSLGVPVENGTQVLRVRVGAAGSPAIGIDYSDHDQRVALGRWMHLAFTWSAATGEVRLYVDGAPVQIATYEGEGLRPSDAPLTIADLNMDGEHDRRFDGRLDEVRLADVAHSPAWLAAQVRFMRGEAVTPGPVEALREE